MLLTHEIVHAAQYAALGWFPAVTRFGVEALNPDNNTVPQSLLDFSIREIVNIVDLEYTLEQLAYRIELGAPSP